MKLRALAPASIEVRLTIVDKSTKHAPLRRTISLSALRARGAIACCRFAVRSAGRNSDESHGNAEVKGSTPDV